MVDYRDLGVRAFKTFVQAFLAVVAVGVVSVSDFTALKALLVAGVAAGISAAMNFVKDTM